jgi:hypothetical protein
MVLTPLGYRLRLLEDRDELELVERLGVDRVGVEVERLGVEVERLGADRVGAE